MRPAEGLWTWTDLIQPATANPKSGAGASNATPACCSKRSGAGPRRAKLAAHEEPNVSAAIQAVQPTASDRPLARSSTLVSSGTVGRACGRTAGHPGPGGTSTKGAWAGWAFNTIKDCTRRPARVCDCGRLVVHLKSAYIVLFYDPSLPGGHRPPGLARHAEDPRSIMPTELEDGEVSIASRRSRCAAQGYSV